MAFDRLGKILQYACLKENAEKIVEPSNEIEFLGVTFNARKCTMEVSIACLHEISALVDKWLSNRTYTRTQLESLIGKLQFVAACVRPGRIFISRLLNLAANNTIRDI